MTKNRKLVLIGDSAFAQIARLYFDQDTDYDVVAFAVELAYLTKSELDGLPVVALEEVEKLFPPAAHSAHVAVVYTQLNRLRARLVASVAAKGYELASYVSPRASILPRVELGTHCFIFEDNTIQPFVRLGANVVLWSGNHIGHHSVIGDNCFVSSHVVISGFCDIGQNSFLGVNSTIANNVAVGADNWIGPNVVISKSTEPDALYGPPEFAPARVTSRRFFKVRD